MHLVPELETLARKGLYRTLREHPGTGARLAVEDGRSLLNFSSNDYLGLARDPRLKQAACDAVQRWGCGATASRLMAGTLPVHARLEERLAGWMKAESALVFGSGYLANLGLVSCLARSGATLVMDRLNHASLIDGAALAGARIRRYPHGDAEALEELLSGLGNTRAPPVVFTESVFSMDGDVAPLTAIARACARQGAWLVVDEAHALGVFGPAGSGVWAGLPEDAETAGIPLIRVGTLSKALGSYGGFIAGPSVVRDLLVNRARGFIYSTGLAPSCVAAAGAALEHLEANPGLGEALLARAAGFREDLARRGFSTEPSASPIVPVRVGDNERSLRVSRELEDRGILCTAVRPPTVPPGTARLRFSVTLEHREEELRQTADAVEAVLRDKEPDYR